MAEATGAFSGRSYWEAGCDCIYSDKLKRLQSKGEAVDIHSTDESFGWHAMPCLNTSLHTCLDIYIHHSE